jgi:Bacterial regulatory proteins, luxR family
VHAAAAALALGLVVGGCGSDDDEEAETQGEAASLENVPWVLSSGLVVSDETVKTHVSRVLSKLHLRDRTQAVVVAYESGLVVPRAHDER